VWCLVSWNSTQPHTANWISEWLWQGSTDFQKCWCHIKILHTRRAKHSKFHTEDPKTFGVNVENLVVWVTWRPEFVHPWVMAKWLTSYGPPSPQSPILHPVNYRNQLSFPGNRQRTPIVLNQDTNHGATIMGEMLKCYW
jgi:hypothetical protein